MIELLPMCNEHIEQVFEVEYDSMPVPWSKDNFIAELNRPYAIYFVAMHETIVVGYCGMWHVINEGHITNIVVKHEFRCMRIGTMLLEKLIAVAIDKEMIGLTLEVRLSNIIAQKLYTKHGFKPDGFRKNYYGDEDAVIMWKYFNMEDNNAKGIEL